MTPLRWSDDPRWLDRRQTLKADLVLIAVAVMAAVLTAVISVTIALYFAR